jgi:hypothetical protein
MSTVTLSTKVYNDLQLKLIEKLLESLLKGLKVDTEIRRVTRRRWVQITVSNEDEKVALRYLADEVGLCPTLLKNVEKFCTLRGYISSIDKKGLHVDLGVSSPSVIDATVPLQQLQAQLADGRKIALKKLAELFGFCQNLPLTVKVLRVDSENNYIEAVLSERQVELYRSWTKNLLDRLIILGASSNRVMLTLRQARCSRDVIDVESLGLFEHAIICKLGTDAKGLIPKIGKKLRNTNFSIFSPRRILKFFGDYAIL